MIRNFCVQSLSLQNPNRLRGILKEIFVFYDGACGLCAKEINHYIKIAPDGVFVWVDISRDETSLKSLGYSREAGLKELHVLAQNGQMRIGVDAFIVIWSELKNWRILAKIARIPLIKKVLTFIYQYFARCRFNRLGYSN